MNAAETHHQNLIPGKKHAPENLGRVLVVGLGKSGKAAVQYCASLLGSRVKSLDVSAGKRNADAEAFVDTFAGQDIRFAFEWETFEDTYDLCIVSPGISDLSDLYKNAAAASAEMVSELEFAWRESETDSLWVAITGTNGKTTTTSLIEHICLSAGLDAHAVGNIGEVALLAVWQAPVKVYVAEISSFQLATTSLFAPDVAVLLNVTPDHLYWHGTMDRYIEAKARVLARLDAASGPEGKGAIAVVDCTDEIAGRLADEFRAGNPDVAIIRMVDAETAAKAKEAGIHGPEYFAYEAEGHLRIRFAHAGDVCAIDDLQIKGEHNVLNALAAASASLALGISAQDVARGLVTFAPLEHRIEPCGEAGGIRFFNDSKGTNVDATLKAFTAFAPKSIICLLGGTDKGTDLTPLVEAARARCKAVVCYGDSRARFLEAFGVDAETAKAGEGYSFGNLDVLVADRMADATRLAVAYASPGDNVLLSPACASFDEFKGYEERGRIFKAQVRDEFGATVPAPAPAPEQING